MLRSYFRIVFFLIFGLTAQAEEKNSACATPSSYVFIEPPEKFSPKMEVSGCYCEYEDRVLLLLRNSEKPQGNTWCIPGGKLQNGETPLQAVIREVKEETGLRLTPQSLRYCHKVYVRFPNADFILHLFRTELSEISKTFKISSKEHHGFRWAAVEDALKMPLIPGGVDCMRMTYHNNR